ncbi:MAG: hypothetical protein GX567_18525 [Clostridia bacterium]|nr:hypothetical protein [Clostridia bacterium]
MKERTRTVIGSMILVASFVLIGIGIVRLEPHTVLTKAINICMECIGIG